MAKTWVLHTETKGTGAHVVPLERASNRTKDPEPLFVPRKPRPRPPQPPKPTAPRRFRVLDVMTRQLLADDVDAAGAIEALKGVRSIVDVTTYVWQEERERWRALTFEEQRALFEMAADLLAEHRPGVVLGEHGDSKALGLP
jgi:hypothetical protein